VTCRRHSPYHSTVVTRLSSVMSSCTQTCPTGGSTHDVATHDRVSTGSRMFNKHMAGHAHGTAAYSSNDLLLQFCINMCMHV
jgi:hypothetical protein